MSATPDPTDAKADGNFGSAGGSHRAGYGDKLANAEKWARKGGTLNAGEGAILCEEIDRLRNLFIAVCFERDAAQPSGALGQWIASLRVGDTLTVDDIHRFGRVELALRNADKHHQQARAMTTTQEGA